MNYSDKILTEKTSFYHLCVEYFAQFSFDSEMYTYIFSNCFETAADYVYISDIWELQTKDHNSMPLNI